MTRWRNRLLLLFEQAAEHSQIFDVFGQVGAFWSFQDHRQIAPALVAENVAESRQPEVTFADVLMPVDARPERFLRIVKMKRHDLFATECLFHFADSCPVTFGSADIIASRENVAGIDADGQPGRMLGRLDDGGEVFKSVAETRTLPGSGLQGDFDRAAFRGGNHFIETLRRIAQIALRAGMQDNEWHAEKCGTMDFVNECDD